MADGKRTVTIDLIGHDRTSPAFSSASRSAHQAEGAFSKAGKTFAAVGRAAATGLVVGVGAASVAMKVFVGDARESERVTKITVSQIKTTGGAANLTAKQIGALATAVSDKTGIDDEAIQANENLLLSFRGIRDEVGKGNKIFSRTTALAQDMATVMGTDASSATLQLGKALNDPVKGLSKLTRSGVVFTDQQVKQVTAMEKAGNKLGAQKVILREVAHEFGGAAAAAATPMDHLKVTLHNVSEAIGKQLLPFIDKGANALLGIIKGFQDGTGTGGRLAGIFHQIANGIKAVVPVVASLVGWVKDNLVPTFVMIATGVGPQLRATFERIFGAIKAHQGVFTQLAQIFRVFAMVQIPLVKAALKTIGVAFQAIVIVLDKVVLPAIKSFILETLLVFGSVVHGAAKAFGWIPGLGGKLKSADKAFQNFRDKVIGIFNGIHGKGYNLGQDFATGLAAGIRAGGKVAVATAVGVANRVAAGYAAAQQSSSPSKVAIRLGEFFSHGLAVGIKQGGKKALAAIKDLADQVASKIGDLRQQARDIASAAADSIRGVLDVSSIGQAVETTTPGKSIIDPVTGAVTQGPDVTTSTTPSAASVVAQAASNAASFVKDLATMTKKGLPASIIAAVAAAGPISGAGAAHAFATESAADDASVISNNRVIEQAAGQDAARARKASGIDEQIASSKRLENKLDRVIEALKHHAVGDVTLKGEDIYVSFKRTEKKHQRAG